MVYTSAFCALAAAHPAPHTGGTVKNTSALLFFSNPTAGSPILETRRKQNDKMPSTTI
jgi:hypothetical protein